MAVAILMLCIVIIPGGSVWGYLRSFMLGVFGVFAYLLPVLTGYVAVINALLLWPACYFFDGIGAAACVLLTTLFGQVIPMNWYYHKRIGLDIPWFWKKIRQLLPSMVVPAAVAVCIALFATVENYFHIVLWGCVFVAVYAVFLWLFGLNRFERDLVTGPLDKVIHRLKRR
jgi:hypothetical protein